jgi:hypothetical protein
MQLPIDYRSAHWSVRKKAREEYIRIQNGKCIHCGESLSINAPAEMMLKKINRSLFPPNFFTRPVHLHHCHKTGLTIGAVHNQCNAVLWQYHGE